MALALSFIANLRALVTATTRRCVGAVRMLERMLPPPVLSLIVWPAALIWSAMELKKDLRALAAWLRFPPQWRPARFIYLLWQTLGFSHSRFVYLWPDRLAEPRWLRRCPLRANYDLEKLLACDRPIIFTSLHFGPFRTLPYWLRAHGIPTTTLIGTPVSPQSAWIDELSAPADVPVLAWVNEMRQIRRSLVGKRRLLILTDVGRGKLMPVPFDNHLFWMATGAIRLAAATGALLVPCLIVEPKATWRFFIHFGAPVPDELSQGAPNLQAVANHLFHELLPVLKNYPAQCRHRLLNAITSSSVDRPDVGVIAHPQLEQP